MYCCRDTAKILTFERSFVVDFELQTRPYITLHIICMATPNFYDGMKDVEDLTCNIDIHE